MHNKYLSSVLNIFKDRNKQLLLAFLAMLLVSLVIFFTMPSDQSFWSRTGEFFRGETTEQEATTIPTNTQGQQPQAVNAVTQQDYSLGDPESAQVILVEYVDLNCVYCAQFHQSMQQVIERFGDQVAWVYRHYPLANSQLESQAAECVGLQGGNQAFWQFVEMYLEDQAEHSVNAPRAERIEVLETKANQLGIDISNCLETGQTSEAVTTDFRNGQAIGLQGTPSTVLIAPETEEYEILAGAYSAEEMIAILQSYIE